MSALRIEIRIGGTGGQGLILSAKMLADAGGTQLDGKVNPVLPGVNRGLALARVGIPEATGPEAQVNQVRASLLHRFAKSFEILSVC